MGESKPRQPIAPTRSDVTHGTRSAQSPATLMRLRRNRYLVLLATLIVALLVQSVDNRLPAWELIVDLPVSLSSIVVALAVFSDRRSRIYSLWWGSAMVALALLRHLFPDSAHFWLELTLRPLSALFLGWATSLILRDVFEQTRIRIDDVVGAVCGYLLAAGAWANLYDLLEVLHPGAFLVGAELAQRLDDWHGRSALFHYFSLATLTSVGYGDIVPVRGPGTILAMLETVFGQFYIAVVVAQLVGMRLAQGPRGSP